MIKDDLRKNCNLILFSILGVFLIITGAVFAYAEGNQFEYGDYLCEIQEDGTVCILKYNGMEDEVIIPETIDGHAVSIIGQGCFAECEAGSILIPEGVKAIEAGAFYECVKLKTIIIPDGVTTIGEYAFAFANNLIEVRIPDSVTEIGEEAFNVCEKLERVFVSPDNPVYATIDNVLFQKQNKELILYPDGQDIAEYRIPNGIETIHYGAFSGNIMLEKIELPDSVVTIEKYAFSSCWSLKEVVFSKNLQNIGEEAFYGNSLVEINLPFGLQSIGNKAFCNCWALQKVFIPDSVNYIGEKAFSVFQGLTEILNTDLVVVVGKNSYAQQYCSDNGLAFQYPDSLDWLEE